MFQENRKPFQIFVRRNKQRLERRNKVEAPSA
jgi:hypothetical protein